MTQVTEGGARALSLIVPAYDEGRRIGTFLDEALPYLDATFPATWELIVVDDGSRDDTAAVVRQRARAGIVLIRHRRNLGKGAAVRTGVAAARGALVLFADADGATPIHEEQRLRQVIDAGADIAIGSREATHVLAEPRLAVPMVGPVARDVRWHRYVIGRTFAFLVRVTLGLPYLDTQCGFKMFRHDVAAALFDRLAQTGYAFDVDILCLARRSGYSVAEVPVCWHDVPGARLRLVRDAWRMLCGVIQVRVRTPDADTPRVVRPDAAESAIEHFR